MRAVRVLERILTAIPIMFGVAVIVFVFMRLTPGDPVDIMMGEAGYISEGEIENLRREFNLDKPIHVQLYLFLANAVRGMASRRGNTVRSYHGAIPRLLRGWQARLSATTRRYSPTE